MKNTIALLILLLFFCSELLSEDLVIKDFAKINIDEFIRNIKTGTDKDEDDSSESFIALSSVRLENQKALKVYTKVLENANLGYQYSFFKIPLEKINASSYSFLEIEMQIDKVAHGFVIQLEEYNDNNVLKKCDTSIDPLITEINKWQKIKIPLSDFTISSGLSKGEKLIKKNITSIKFFINKPFIGSYYIKNIKFTQDVDDLVSEMEESLKEEEISIQETVESKGIRYLVTDFNNCRNPLPWGGEVGPMSDRDEDIYSKTIIIAVFTKESGEVYSKKGCSYKLEYHIKNNFNLGYQYGGVYITVPEINITDYEYLSLKIKGDFKEFDFQISEKGERKGYSAPLYKYYKNNSEWHDIKIPLREFIGSDGRSIRGYNVNSVSISSTIPGDGVVFLDDIAFIGNIVKAKRNVILGIRSISRFESTRDTTGIHDISQTAEIDISGHVNKVCLAGRIYLDTRGFSKSKWVEEYYSKDHLVPQDVLSSGISLELKNLNAYFKYIDSLSIGALDLDYGQYTIFQKWFYEGILLEGDYKPLKSNNELAYQGFLLKHWYDTLTYGGHLKSEIPKRTRIDMTIVDYCRTGNISETDDIQSTTIFDEVVSIIQVGQRLSAVVTVTGFAGYLNRIYYYFPAEVNSMDGTIYGEKLHQPREEEGAGYYGIFKCSQFLIPGMSFKAQYRYIDQYFNAQHRNLNVDYLDYDGWTLELTQHFWRLFASGNYGESVRPSAQNYRAYSYGSSLGFNGKHNVIVVTYTYKEDKNKAINLQRIENRFRLTLSSDIANRVRFSARITGGMVDLYQKRDNIDDVKERDLDMWEKQPDGRFKAKIDGWNLANIEGVMSYRISAISALYLEYEVTEPDNYYVYWNPNVWDNYLKLRLIINF